MKFRSISPAGVLTENHTGTPSPARRRRRRHEGQMQQGQPRRTADPHVLAVLRAVEVGFEPTEELPLHTLSRSAAGGPPQVGTVRDLPFSGVVMDLEHPRTLANETTTETKRDGERSEVGEPDAKNYRGGSPRPLQPALAPLQ